MKGMDGGEDIRCKLLMNLGGYTRSSSVTHHTCQKVDKNVN